MAQWVQCVPPWQYTTKGARRGPSALSSAVLPSMNVPLPKMTSSSYPGVTPAHQHPYQAMNLMDVQNIHTDSLRPWPALAPGCSVSCKQLSACLESACCDAPLPSRPSLCNPPFVGVLPAIPGRNKESS